MKNFLANFKKTLRFPFSFLLIMLLFLGVCLGTAGSVKSTGKSFELQKSTDSNWSWVIFKITPPKTKDEDGNEKDLSVRLSDVYINVGKIYSGEETATLELQHGYSTSKADEFSRRSGMTRAVLYNSSYVAPEDAKEKTEEETKDYIYDWEYSWINPFGVPNAQDVYKSVSSSSPSYWKLVLPRVDSKYKNSNVLVNEIVFVGEVLDGSKGTGELVLLPAEIDSRTKVPAADDKEGLAHAEALLDSQQLPVLSESSFFRYGAEEKKMLMTISEMRMGSTYVPNDTYDGDRTYNSLGLSLSCLGTLIFGMSPFGLRFFNTLASFGILVVGFFFVKRLFKNEKAGLSFAVIYALCGVSMSLAHLASPIMLGVFFLLSSLAACYPFFESGMKKPTPASTLPLLASGIAGALAVLVNGAFVVPVAGVAALFVAGVIKQHFKNRARLKEAIAFAEEEKAQGIPALSADGTEESEGNRRVRKALSAYKYETAASSSVFACSLILGIFVFSILFALPVFYAADRIYNGVVVTSSNLFKIAWNLFAAGFTRDISGWNYLYPIFTGTGELYAATYGMMNFAASLLGLCGIAFGIYRIVTLAMKKAKLTDYYSVIIPLAGMALSLVTAAFAGGSVAFVLLANLFAFMLVSGGAELFAEEGAKRAKAVFIIKIAALVLLVCCFALTAVFTFSVPLPAAFIQQFV